MIPLLPTHPELSVTTNPHYTIYKVHNWRLKPDGTGRVVHGAAIWSWSEALISLSLALLYARHQHNTYFTWACFLTALTLVYRKCTQVLSESVLVIPPHGIQLETERGLPGLTLSTTRQFIPTCMLRDVLINEGLSGWNVRYYLVAICNTQQGHFFLKVAFENILPRFPVLVEVYNGVQELLFEPAQQVSDAPAQS